MLGDDHIGSEHLLLGILEEGIGWGVRLLRDLGVDLPRLHDNHRAVTAQRLILAHARPLSDLWTRLV